MTVETTEIGSYTVTAYRCTCHNWPWRWCDEGFVEDRPSWVAGLRDFDESIHVFPTVEALAEVHTLRPTDVDNVEALLADRERLAAEAADLRALVSTCICPSWPPEGPSEECPVDGAVRAFNDATTALAEMTADRDAMIPIVTAAQKLVLGWRMSGTSGLPWTPRALLDAVNAYQAGAIPVAVDRGAPTTPAVGNDVPESTPEPQKTAEGLVADLLRVSANLEEHIQTRADERAARQAAQEIADANGAIRAVVERMEFDKQRSDALIAELRRQLDVQVKQVEHYWPQVKRVQALADVWCKAGKAGDAQDIYEALNPKEAEVTTNA